MGRLRLLSRLAAVWALGASGCTAPEPVPDYCPFDSGEVAYDAKSAYPFCQLTGDAGYLEYCPQTDQGWGASFWHAEGADSRLCANDDECNACTCFAPCGAPSDCPLPGTGTAPPDCLVKVRGGDRPGSCFLRCDEGQACPDGMECHLFPEDPAWVCAWITSGSRCDL